MSVAFPVTADPRFRLSTATVGQTVFSVPFPFQANADIAVVRYAIDGAETELVEGVGYTLTGEGSPSGGSVSLAVPATAGEQILRVGRAVLDRVQSVVRSGRFKSKAIDDDIDRFIIIAQELARDVKRSWKAPYGQTPGKIVVGDAGSTVKFDALGNLVQGPGADVIEGVEPAAIQAGIAQVKAELAALAAGAALFGSIADGEANTSNGKVFLVSTEAGVQVFKKVAGPSEMLGWLGQTHFATVVALKSFNGALGPAGTVITAQGYRYQVATSSTSDHHLTTAGGVKLYLAETFVTPAMFGALTGSNDAVFSSAIAVAAALLLPLVIPGRVWHFTGQVDLSPLLGGAAQIRLEGDSTFDFGGASVAANFPDDSFVVINGGALSYLGDNAGAIAELDRSFSITSPLFSPAVGDVLCVYNPDDGSFLNWPGRPYYRAGEYVRVARYAAGLATLQGSFLAGYSSGSLYVYKHPAKKITVEGGRVFIKEPLGSAFDVFFSLRATRLADSDLHAFVPTNPSYAGMLLDQCVGIYGDGYHVEQNRAVGPDNYGLVFANCQDCDISGYFAALKHAVTAGGFDKPGCVPNSNIRVNGTMRNIGPASPGSGLMAANLHGNSRNCRFGGFIDGGVSMGGNNNGVLPGTIIRARVEGRGIAILLTEMLGHNFDFSRSQIKARGNPDTSSRATIDIGANGDAATSATLFGGTINLDGTEIDAPESARPMTYQNRGYVGGEKVAVSLRGATLKESAASPIIVIAAASGRTIDWLHLDGFSNLGGASYSMAGVDKIRGWCVSGVVSLAPVVGQATAMATVSYKAPKVPAIVVTPHALVAGGKSAKPLALSVGQTSASVGLGTMDNTGFSSTSAATASWFASVND